MSEGYSIREWTASLYLETPRKWVYGCLSLTPHGIVFTENKDLGHVLKINYEHFIEMKKTKSSYIFGAVIILAKSGVKHWFSSLPDRDCIYLTILHFWRNRIVSDDNWRRSESPDSENPGRSIIGSALIQIARDAEKSLETAASQLHSQGKQISGAIPTVHDLHHDLDIANNLVSGMESWLFRWHLPKQYHTIDPVMIYESDVPEMYETEVLYTRLEYGKSHSQNVGLLRVAGDGLFVLTPQQKIVQLFSWLDISKIRVINPWEIVVTKYLIGQPDLSYDILTTNLIGCLHLFEKYVKSKLDYETPPAASPKSDKLDRDKRFSFPRPESSASVIGRISPEPKTPIITGHVSNIPRHSAGQPSSRDISPLDTGHNILNFPKTAIDGGTKHRTTQNIASQLQAHRVSEDEMDALSKTLERMKSMALEISTELPEQMTSLDTLSSTVDNANIRLKETTKRVQRLT